jgi:hypothetical protein
LVKIAINHKTTNHRNLFSGGLQLPSLTDGTFDILRINPMFFVRFGPFGAVRHHDPKDNVKQDDRKCYRNENAQNEKYTDDRYIYIQIICDSGCYTTYDFAACIAK